MEELRELAHGIHPGILDAGWARRRRSSRSRPGCRCPVTVDADRRSACRPSVEATAYFVASEALTNVAKHAQRVERGRARAARGRRCSWSRSRTTARAARGPGRGRGSAGLADRLESRGGRLRVESPPGSGTRVHRGDPVRVVIAEDSVLLREGLARVLADGGFEVVAQAGDADELRRDVRMLEARRRDRGHPHAADADRRGRARPRSSSAPSSPRSRCSSCRRSSRRRTRSRSLSERPAGFGYLLKDRVARRSTTSWRRCGAWAKGGTAIDPEVIAQLLGRRRERRTRSAC